MLRFTLLASMLAVMLMAISPVVASAQDGDEEDTAVSDEYVPRTERDTDAVMTFVGNKRGLKIVDHRTGETTYYSSRPETTLHRLSPEVQEREEAARQKRKEAAEAAAKAQAEAEAEAAAAQEGENAGEAEQGGESSDES